MPLPSGQVKALRSDADQGAEPGCKRHAPARAATGRAAQFIGKGKWCCQRGLNPVGNRTSLCLCWSILTTQRDLCTCAVS